MPAWNVAALPLALLLFFSRQRLLAVLPRERRGPVATASAGTTAGADSDSDDGEVGSAASPRTPGAAPPAPSFLENSGACVTHLRISDEAQSVYSDEEQLPGESDDEDGDGFRGRFGSARRRRSKKSRKNHRRVVIQMLSSKYEVVAQAARGMGWRRATDESEEYNLLWADSYIPFDTIASLNKYQKARHSAEGGTVWRMWVEAGVRERVRGRC